MNWFIVYTALLIVLTFLSAVCSSSETALFSLPIAKTNLWRNSADDRKRSVAHLLAHSRHLLVLIFILNTIVNICLQNTSSELAESTGGGWLTKVFVPLTLIVIFGEFFPKYLGLVYRESFSLKVAPLFVLLEKIFFPIQVVVTTVAETLSRVVFFFLKREPPLTPKELESILIDCEEKSILSHQESIVIRASIDFDSKQAREIMTPRFSVEYIPIQAFSIDKAKEFVQRFKKDAILIVDETPDRPLGALSGFEALASAKSGLKEQIKKNLFYAPETISTRKLLQDFAAKQTKIACLVDEHGTVSGFVYRSDLSKQVLGFQSTATGSPKTSDSYSEKTHVFQGTTTLSTINKLYGKQLTSPHHSTTISGWLIEKLDGIPQAGTCLVSDELEFRIIIASPKAIDQVFIQKSRRNDGGFS